MLLRQRFIQRPLEISTFKGRPLVPDTYLGFQFADTDLEEDLLVQLMTCWHVMDLIAHPVIKVNNDRTLFCPDVLFETKPDCRENQVVQYLVYVRGNGDNRPIHELEQAVKWCERTDTRLRILDERQIRTGYLETAKRLNVVINVFPESNPDALTRLDNGPRANPMTFAEALTLVTPFFENRDDAGLFIDSCIKSGLVVCDLKVPLDDRTILKGFNYEIVEDLRSYPILASIEDGPAGTPTIRRP